MLDVTVRVARIAAAVTLVMALGACSSGDGGVEDPRTAGSASSSPEDSAEPAGETPTESTSETPSETPTVAPATGPKLDVEGITVRMPERWERGYDTAVAATGSGPQGVILLGALAGEPMSLRALMKRDVATLRSENVKRLDDVTLRGLPAYHYTASDGHYTTHVYGLWDDGYRVHVALDLRDHYSDARRRSIAESVMATYGS